jgi:hypothetical protein
VQETFLSSKTSGPDIEQSQPPVEWVRVLFLEVKRTGREPDQSPSSRTTLNNEWSYTATPSLCLPVVKRDNLTLYQICETERHETAQLQMSSRQQGHKTEQVVSEITLSLYRYERHLRQ